MSHPVTARRADPQALLASLALDLHKVIAEVEAGLLHRQDARLAGQQPQVADLAAGLQAVAPELPPALTELALEASATLQALAPELAAAPPRWDVLRTRWEATVRAYEALRVAVRRLLPVASAERLGTVKPLNLKRNLFHVAMGVTGVALYQWVLSQTAVLILGGSILALFLGLELVRRRVPGLNEHLVNRVLGGISRAGEAHRVPSATWYLLGLLVGVVVFPKVAVALGTLVLAVGDPAASILGKLWGRRKLIGQKSLVGTLGFVGVAWAASVGYLALAAPGLGPGGIAGVAAVAAIAGALAELGSHRLDDNLTIPLLASAAVTFFL